jgi:hypothetical protein
MRTLVVLAAVLVGLSLAVAAPAFECGVTPGEGIMRFGAGAEPLLLRSAPSSLAAPAGALELAEGTEIRYDEARVRTVVPGLLVATADGSLAGSSYGPISYLSREDYIAFGAGDREYTLAAGDTIEYLMYRAEGDFFARARGDVVAVHSLPEGSGLMKRVREPVTELWIRVVAPDDGRPVGWLLVTDAVRELPRTF